VNEAAGAGLTPDSAATVVFHPRWRWRAAAGTLQLAMGLVLAASLWPGLSWLGQAQGTIPRTILLVLAVALAMTAAGALALLRVLLGRPFLRVDADGLVLQGLFRRRQASWAELSAFEHLRPGDRGRGWRAVASLVPAPGRPAPRRPRRVVLGDWFQQPLDHILPVIQARHLRATGTPPPPDPRPDWDAEEQRFGLSGARPWATLGLLALLLAVFAAELRLSGTGGLSPSLPALLALGGSNASLVLEQGEWHRLFSSVLLHAGPAHLLGNGVSLLLIGWLLEPLLGRAWLLAAFAIGGLGGALATLAAHLGSGTVSIGASGAIAGLFGTGVIVAFRLPAGTRARARLRSRAVAVLVPALLPLAARSGSGGEVVDYAAHLGGALAGALLGLLLWWRWRDDARLPPFRRAGAVLAALGLAAFLGSGGVVASRIGASPFLGLIPAAEEARLDSEDEAGALIHAYPADPRGYLLRATGHYRLRQWAAAEADLRETLRRGGALAPLLQQFHGFHVRAMLAEVLLHQNQRDEAARVLAPVCEAPLATMQEIRAMTWLRARGLCAAGP
jgi:rhomboid protease GluP